MFIDNANYGSLKTKLITGRRLINRCDWFKSVDTWYQSEFCSKGIGVCKFAIYWRTSDQSGSLAINPDHSQLFIAKVPGNTTKMEKNVGKNLGEVIRWLCNKVLYNDIDVYFEVFEHSKWKCSLLNLAESHCIHTNRCGYLELNVHMAGMKVWSKL